MRLLNNYICQIGLAILAACSPQLEKSDNPKPIEIETSYDVPAVAKPYVKYYLKHRNPSRNMAQTEQECSWNHYAISRAGAIGCAQVMPETLEHGSKTWARHLGEPQPNNPRYAAEFLESYMKFFTIDMMDDYCSNRKVDEQRYNGGFYIIWELRESDGTLEGAESICGVKRLSNGKLRSKNSCDENYKYPKHVSRRQVKYKSIGGIVCQ